MASNFRVGQYVFERPLGEGGMAEVWLARNIHVGTPVAIKFLNAAFAGKPQIEQRFINEARLQGGLSHPNIVKVYGFEIVENRSFLILQYVDGESLADLLHRVRRLETAEALRIAISVLNALDFAHANGLVHRDIKPSNILLDKNGFPYLGDFGIVLATNERRMTVTGTAIGTALYMSPEQLTNASAVDGRSDIYSFGCVLYEMLSGEPPFNPPAVVGVDTDFTIKAAHVQQAPPPLRTRTGAVAPAVEAVVMRCLAKSPVHRYATCREVRDALSAAMVARTPAPEPRPQRPEIPTPRPPDRVPLPSQRGIFRRKAIYIWTFTVLVVLVAGFFIVRHQLLESDFRQAEKLYADRDYPAAMALFRKAADTGNHKAEEYLGVMYLNGEGVPRDCTISRLWAEKAASAGLARAMNNLGVVYESGCGVTQDYGQARLWFEKSANAGEPRGMNSLGRLYDSGHGVTKDYDQAKSWYEKAADAGNTDAMEGIGSLYYEGHGVTQDYALARHWYQKASDAGNAKGMFDLGLMYDDGNGVKQDYSQARQWYEKAAAAGNANAMCNLGALYANGQGVARDYAQARQWYEKAAAGGDVTAEYDIGILYAKGQGVTQNYTEAADWFNKSAAAGYASAMTYLGVLYANGQGLTQDFLKARQWYEKAVDAGDDLAMNNLGALYANGQGVTQDYTQARLWYEKGAAAGNAIAMKNLGKMYISGQGVTPDATQARFWLQKAADAGNDDAKEILARM